MNALSLTEAMLEPCLLLCAHAAKPACKKGDTVRAPMPSSDLPRRMGMEE